MERQIKLLYQILSVSFVLAMSAGGVKRSHESAMSVAGVGVIEQEEDDNDFGLASWDQKELALFSKLSTDAKHLQKIQSLDAEFVLRIAARPIHYWKEGELHPLLLCRCTVPLKCKYLAGTPARIQFGCSLWSPAASRSHEAAVARHQQSKSSDPPPQPPFCDCRLYDRDIKAILERIEALLGRPSAMRQFFCPLQVRMAQHVGFGLVNHTPPLADEKRWKLYDKLFLLSERPDAVTVQHIKHWNSVQDDPPNPTPFDGFEPAGAEKACLRAAVAHLQSLGYQLAQDFVVAHPTPTSDETPLYESYIESLKDDSLLISSVPLLTRMSHQYDYTLHLGQSHAIPAKVLVNWRDNNMVCIPLHGMGKYDLGFLYGASQVVLYHLGTNFLALDTHKLYRAAKKLAASLPMESYSPPALAPLQKTSVSVGDLTALNVKPVYKSDVEWHNHSSSELACGPACMDVDDATALQNDWETPGPVEHIPHDRPSIIKASLSQGKAKDVYLIFSPTSFLTWCKSETLAFEFVPPRT